MAVTRFQGRNDELTVGGVETRRRSRKREIVGRYANCFEVGHNPCEFLFDFGQSYDGGVAGTVHTRIVTGPVHAKALLNLLHRSIEQYESTFGRIRSG